MARKGVAKGKAGATHELTEAKQGKYHYVYGPYAEPVLRIKPGDIVVAETQDAFEGAIKSESDKPTEMLQHAVPQSAMRPDRGRGRGEGRRALRPHPFDQAARAAAGRHHGADPRVRRAGRDRATRRMLNRRCPSG